MDYIKQYFSIKDLEHLCGVKAHTIRIWEKRYNILNPERTGTNIRIYGIPCLQKILNVTFLKNHGYSISRIAKLTDEELSSMVKEIHSGDSLRQSVLNSFKVAMVSFDQKLFNSRYNELIKTKSFREIFQQILLPLLDEIGLLWQTDSINPVHEHFLTGLIKQKIYMNIALLENYDNYKGEDLFILFLPENEIHDLGLLYLNYELNLHRQRTVYLGSSLKINQMKYLLEIHPNPKFISYLTISPRSVDEFIDTFETELCRDSVKELNLFGARIQSLDSTLQPHHIKIYKSIPEFVNSLE